MIAEAEIWQVQTGGETYQADLETLKGWVAEGLVQPSDQVRKGNLRWIEAGRAPLLRRVFSGAEAVTLPAPSVETQAVAPDAPPVETQAAAPSSVFDAMPPATFYAPHTATIRTTPTLSAEAGCYHHPQAAPKYVCRVCHTLFCPECPKYIEGGRTALCALCGDFCQLYEDVRERSSRGALRSSGYGFADFAQAVRYPFQNIVGLVVMAVVYGLLQIGGWRGALAAYVVMFGCTALVIKQMAWGRFDRSFLPDFSAFSLWDDCVMPCFLGLGITLVTLAPAILLTIALLFGWFGNAKQLAAPLTVPVNAETQEPSQSPAQQQQQSQQLSEKDFAEFVNSTDPQKNAEFIKKIERMRGQQQVGGMVKEADAAETGMIKNIMVALMTSPGLILLFGFGALLWAFCYYPIALTMAGYTGDFKAVINPLVGLDTMRRMGMNYVKAFAMYAVVEAVGYALLIIIERFTAPLDMPLIGNLPGKFLEGAVAFYFNLVIACLLGLALYKSADRLEIETD